MNRAPKIANAVAGAALLTAAVLRLFPPETNSFYPECPVFHFFHVYCPGCGATRAFAALTRGDLTTALHYNALVVVLLPLVFGYFGLAYWNAICQDEFKWPRIPARAVVGITAAALLFGVLRNVFFGSL